MRRTAPRQQKDALGRRLCRVPACGKVVPRGRRSYCSAECRSVFEVAYFPQFTRRAVFERDRGVCALCRVDTEKLRRIFRRITYQDALAVAHELGFDGAIYGGDFWQADHVRECARGGWGLGLENFRTLCTPCHKAESARLARELAEARRAAADGGSLFSEVR